jgi:dienelactone hydrolase
MRDSFGLGRIREELELLLGKSLPFAEHSTSFQSSQVRWNHWPKVSALLTRKLKQMEAEGIDPAKIYMYGHSLGARMVIDAGIKFGPNRIGMIDGDGND